ncbi:ATP/GTP-binding protein [Streptomyces xanthochromogenes]|uniref:ATP/GTP-binding protein n=1 Tax=Streptomyces xanthochromogenes TaxID=67384 RepID=UPI0037F76B78
MDLRTLFGSNDPIESGEAFTNRQAQWERVASALDRHLWRLNDPSFNVEDLEAPRTNVIMFHGVGGVGKSTLLRKIEAALTSAEQRPAQWGAPAWTGDRLLPIRIDLSRSAGMDFERVVLTIRLALAARVGRSLPSFDLALRRYWDAQHPGEPLEDYVRRTGLVGRFGQALPQQLQSAVGEIVGTLQLPGLVGSAAGQVTAALVSALRERRERAQALAGCARTAMLLEAEPDLDALSFYPHLLAWEISRLPAKSAVVPVILFDTFEDTADRHRDFERLLQRVVWLLPNAFFVISGRSRLSWAEESLQGQLDHTGPHDWPQLAAPAGQSARELGHQGGRQHLLGDFSPEDCDGYLARRLTHEGQPLIGPDIRAVITERSHGLPLHLDLAVARFLEIRRTGRAPEPADFDHTFPALIARTLSDLTDDERHVLRSASLLDAFDLDLATRAAGLPHQSAARRLIERPMVTEDPFALWPYHLHGAIRAALRSADDQGSDGWTPADWHRAAERALAALGDQWRSNEHPRASARTLLVACLRQGLRLARDHQLSDGLGWLTDAAFAYDSDAIWEPLAPPALPQGGERSSLALDSPADALAELLTTIARRQREHRERTVERLTDILATGLLPAELAEMAEYYRAKANRDIGNNEASRAGMQQVAAAGGRFALRARRGLAHAARIDGDFPTALAATHGLGFEGGEQRVVGDIWWAQADTGQALSAYEQARTEAEEHGNAGEQAIAQARIALTTAFTDPARGDDEIALATQLLQGLSQRATALIVHIATLARDAGADEVPDRAQVLRSELHVAGLTWLEPTLDVALAFHHAVLRNDQQLATVADHLRDTTDTGGYAYHADIALYLAGRPSPQSQTRWLDDEPAVRERWHTLVTDRRTYLNSPS